MLLSICFLTFTAFKLEAHGAFLPGGESRIEGTLNDTAIPVYSAADVNIRPWPWGVVPIPNLRQANLEFRLYGLGEKTGYLGALVHCLETGIRFTRPYATKNLRLPVEPQICIIEGLELYMYPTSQAGSGARVLAALLYFKELVKEWVKVKTSAIVVTHEEYSVPDLMIAIFIAV